MKDSTRQSSKLPTRPGPVTTQAEQISGLSASTLLKLPQCGKIDFLLEYLWKCVLFSGLFPACLSPRGLCQPMITASSSFWPHSRESSGSNHESEVRTRVTFPERAITRLPPVQWELLKRIKRSEVNIYLEVWRRKEKDFRQ